MKTRRAPLPIVILLISIITAFTTSSTAQTPIPAGAVNGTWSVSGSPYQIMGEIFILSGHSLVIDPGVTVEFQGHYKFLVQGSLIAKGANNDTIFFTINDSTGWHDINITDGGWHGIRFGYGGPTIDSSRFKYCVFAFGKATSQEYLDKSGGAIAVYQYDNLMISNSFFYKNAALDAGGAVAIAESNITLEENNYFHNAAVNGGAIAAMGSSPSIAKSFFVDNHASNSGGGISLFLGCNGDITANLFAGNFADYGGAMQFETNCNPLVLNNLIYSNVAYVEGGGADIEGNSQASFINNTIIENIALFGGGIDVEVNSSPVFRNCILWGNTAFVDGPQIHLFSEDSDPDFYYCNIEGGIDSIGTWYGGSIYLNYEGIYENNIDLEPIFTSLGIYQYLLDDESPCIDAGDPDPIYNDLEDPGLPGVALWPSKGTLRNDMGSWGGPYVWYYDITTSLDELQGKSNANQTIESFRCFPNPCGQNCHIAYWNKLKQHISVGVFDISGKLVAELYNDIQAEGKYDLTFNAGSLNDGIYFVIIQSGKKVFSEKIVVMK